MKKYISHLVFALLGCAALSACVDDDYMELDKGQNELVLTASKTEVVLNEQAHADDGAFIVWRVPGVVNIKGEVIILADRIMQQHA